MRPLLALWRRLRRWMRVDTDERDRMIDEVIAARDAVEAEYVASGPHPRPLVHYELLSVGTPWGADVATNGVGQYVTSQCVEGYCFPSLEAARAAAVGRGEYVVVRWRVGRQLKEGGPFGPLYHLYDPEVID